MAKHRGKKGGARFGGWWLAPLVLSVLLLVYQYGFVASAAVREPIPPAPVSSRPSPYGKSLGPMTLHGPGGPATVGQGIPSVVHVWLQGCSDCMPAFEAVKQMRGEYPLPVINVAYGQASPEWAERYGLNENLVFDRGEQIVRPMGIGTFTTLVLDERGGVQLIDRPNRVGYMQRIQGVAQRLKTVGSNPSPWTKSHGLFWSFRPVTLVAPLLLMSLGLAVWPRWRRRRGQRASGPLRFASVSPLVAALQPEQRCPYCHGDLSRREDLSRCCGCETVYHLACVQESNSCTTLGCANFRAFQL